MKKLKSAIKVYGHNWLMLAGALIIGVGGYYLSLNLRSNASVGTRVSGGNVQAFAPAFFGGGTSAGTEGFVDASSDARNFDMIVENPGFNCVGQTYSLPGGGTKITNWQTIANMKAINPNLKYLLYEDGTFQNGNDPVPSSLSSVGSASSYVCDSATKQAFSFATSDAALNSAGSKLKHSGDLLLKPDSSNWNTSRAQGCKYLLGLYQGKVDGCFYDNMGLAALAPGYVNPIPDCGSCSHVLVKADGTPYTATEWLTAKNNQINTIKAANPGALMTGNGLQEGTAYSKTSMLYNTMDYIMAEVFVRGPDDPIAGVPQGAVVTNDTRTGGIGDWELQVKMIQDAATRPTKKIMMTSKVWDLGGSCSKATDCTADKNTIHKYSLATYLMGIAANKASNNAYFFFTYEKTGASYYAYKNWWNLDLGNATGDYLPVSGKTNVFMRRFQKGLVVVNASNSDAGTIDLGGNYVEIGDDPMVINTSGTVSSVSLTARHAAIFTAAAAPPTDTTPPSTVSGLVATPMSASSIDLHWNAAADAESGISGYDIYRKTSSTGSYSKLTTVTNTIYTDSSLAASTHYYYQVKAKNGAGLYSVNFSNEADAVTNPTTPTGDTQNPVVSITQPTAGSNVYGIMPISINASDNVGVSFVTVMVDEHTVGNLLTAPYTTSYDVSGLSLGTHFIFVTAYDSAGNSARDYLAFTVVSAPVDSTPPTTPTGLLSTGQTASSIDLSWTASTDNVAVAGYLIFRSGSQIAVTGASTTSYTDSGLISGTSYSYQVAAKDAIGNISGLSAAVNVSTVNPSAGLLGDIDGNGSVSITEAIQTITNWRNSAAVSGRRFGDKDGNGTVSLTEVIEVLNNWQHPAH